MRKTALMLAPALAISLGACSSSTSTPLSTAVSGATRVGSTAGPGPSPSTSATSTSGSASTSSGTSGAATASATSATSVVATGSPSSPVALPTSFTAIDKAIKDPDLGHEIVVARIARNLPWPDGYQASAAAYELVAVEMRWTPGTTFTAPIRLQDFAITTGSASPNRADALVNAALQAAGWALLPAQVPNGQSVTGWVVFRVEPRNAPKMVVDYTRPTSQVTDSGTIFPTQTFGAQIVG
ncbi:hypothetical protein [Lapillicoccus sp.]|uniref:hypothetical protein n=1 Tax=Lapillicoccus sp. TaxID=1909287 RepID=UPI003982F03F